MGENKKKQKVFIAAIIMIAAAAACAAAALIYLGMKDVLPHKYFFPAVLAAAVILAISVILALIKKHRKVLCAVSIVISCLLIALSLFTLIFMINVYNKLERMNDDSPVEITSTMGVYVRKDAGYKDISELKGKSFAILENMDHENTEKAVAVISGEMQENIKTDPVKGILALARMLQDEDTEAIIVNESFESLITEHDESFDEWAEKIYSCDVDTVVARPVKETGTVSAGSESVTPAPTPEPAAVEPFVMYISGMDTRGDQIVAAVGNSDVNILVAVNPSTRKVLTVSIPRDYYYYLWGDENYPDKLTHSGYYGIDCGIDTVSAIFGIEIDYYAKVGFNSVINVVDALGGITVYSDYDFTILGYTFTVGENHLDGGAALAFSRERKSLPGGDRARGRNQQEVIKAIIKKITSAEVIKNINKVLDILTTNIATDFPVENMNKIVKMQLSDPSPWEITNIQVDGAGDWQYCYSLGDSNDVMIPYWDTVEDAKRQIEEILNER